MGLKFLTSGELAREQQSRFFERSAGSPVLRISMFAAAVQWLESGWGACLCRHTSFDEREEAAFRRGSVANSEELSSPKTAVLWSSSDRRLSAEREKEREGLREENLPPPFRVDRGNSAARTEIAACRFTAHAQWAPAHYLLHVGPRARQRGHAGLLMWAGHGWMYACSVNNGIS